MPETVWIIGEGISILVLIGLSAFFSGSETALTSISLSKINQIAGKDHEDHPLFDWLHHPTKYLTTLLVGNNIVNIGAALIAGDFFRRLVAQTYPSANSDAIAAGLAFVILTGMVLVFGEIIPKSYSRHHCEQIAPKVAVPLATMYRFLRYPIRFFMIVSNLIIRAFGGETSKDLPFVTSDDLKLMIEVGDRQGLFDGDEREMLHSIFDLSETPVREVMTPRVDMIYVTVKDQLEQVLKAFEDHDFSRLPVIKDNRDNVVGILYMKDLLHRWSCGDQTNHIVEKLMRPCLFVPENKRLDDVLKQFQESKMHMAIVVDEYGGTAGLVTIEDILEEIVGEIQDEFDEEEPSIVASDDNTWVVEAAVNPEELLDELGEEWVTAAHAFDSLAGYILERVGDLPKTDDSIELDGVRFTILEADERRITKVRVERILEAQPSPPEDPVPEKAA